MSSLHSADRRAWWMSAAAMAAWLVAATIGQHWGRVAEHWESAVTMLFGSFLAGSSPEGGGAVAFPVFTKGLDVPGPVARTFGLSIQAVGMTVAAAAILITRRPIHARATVIAAGAGVLGLLVGLVALGESDQVFWPSTIPTQWVKATFSIVLATTSVMMIRHLRRGEVDHSPQAWTQRHDVGLGVAAVLGGGLASMTGTGANIIVFLFLVLLADVNPKTALASAVIVMAVVSVAGTIVLGIVDGQLAVSLEAGRVVQVGSDTVDLRADRNDLFGLWFAAAPVVVWGAPLGSWVADRVREAHLVAFVAVLAAAEVLTTAVLVEELRSEGPLVVYLAAGLVLAPLGMVWMRSRRALIFAGTQTGSGAS